ncbi:hypothetical protein B7494_g3003 [Chlorociboria aeruginascens]|nr:hypothetical protein B7494_g3003 [Chlorociboria aeruginascens]
MLFSVLAAGLIGSSLINAHMIMNTPAPYGKPDNSPLSASGSDFPCKGIPWSGGTPTTMAIGSTQPLEFTGVAVHGGGSCQVSISYDTVNSKAAVFKVIHSIEGGCPSRDATGNLPGDNAAAPDPDTYSFTIPAALPTGSATLAWTWFNRVGNREMYMNCAPITITAAASKRSDDDELLARNGTQLMVRDQAAYNALPNMFVANIGNGCTTTENNNIGFPDAGDSVEKLNSVAPVTVTDAGCLAANPTGSSGPAGTAPAGTGATSTAASSGATYSSSGLPGGVFATVPASGSTATSTAYASSVSSVAATSVGTSTPPVSTGTSGGGSAMAAGTACTDEGDWNCIGGSSFQRCASGAWSEVQQLADGTTCTPGISSVINMGTKRAIRFSNEHVRRHMLHAS